MNFSKLLLFPLFLIFYKANAQHKYDVVVYGGTPAGITAAIQVAKMGQSVVLLENSKHLGGIMVEGLGGTDIDNYKTFRNSAAVGGLALEFYRRISKAYGRTAEFEEMLKTKEKKTHLWRFEPHIAEEVIKQWVAEYKIDVAYNSQLQENSRAVSKKGTAIQQIKLTNGKTYQGKMFIDATLEGDLLYRSGVSTTIGREANSLYQETKNGIRAVTDHAQFSVKVDPYKTPGDPNSGLIPTIQNEFLGEPGTGDHRIQAFCFRMCLTQQEENKIPFTKPKNYDRSLYEIYLRYEKAGGQLYIPNVRLPNGKTDLGAWHDLSHNLYGMNFEYPGGSYATRQKIYDQHKSFTQGLFYFLANDTAVSERIRNNWSKWGLAKDEFKDNEGWPRQFYIRDGRRMVSDYVITEHHLKKDHPTPVSDPVAIAFWPPDVHSVRRIVKDGFAYNEGFVFGGEDWQPLPISYRSIVPKTTECSNIFAASSPSSSHIAYGAIRIEFTFMALGQVCGTAAVLANQKQIAVQNLNYIDLKKSLIEQQQILTVE